MADKPQKFRKKPVVVEAMRYSIDSCRAIHDWMGIPHPRGLYDCDRGIFLDTLEGLMEARLGDWIIKGTQGEFYPCKPAAFEDTFELAEDKETVDAE